MNIHQLLVGAAPGDAISSMAIELQRAFSFAGDSNIYALHIDSRINQAGAAAVHPLSNISSLTSSDVIVYHCSMGEPVIDTALAETEAKIVLHYHNITPEQYFVKSSPQHALTSYWGRRQLQQLLPVVVSASADSRFNANELTSIGYQNVHVSPAGLKTGRLKGQVDLATLGEIKGRFPSGYLVVLSQKLPHKRFELAISTLHLLQTLWEMPNLGLILIGRTPDGPYNRGLQYFAKSLGVQNIEFWESANDSEVASAVSGSQALLVTSDHEGLGIPALEAMSMGVPVVARGCGATAETLGNAAIVGPPNSGASWLSFATSRLLTNQSLRRSLIVRGRERALQLERQGNIWSYFRWLESHL